MTSTTNAWRNDISRAERPAGAPMTTVLVEDHRTNLHRRQGPVTAGWRRRNNATDRNKATYPAMRNRVVKRAMFSAPSCVMYNR